MSMDAAQAQMPDFDLDHDNDHTALMDRMYHGQRHIYDATRKYYLFGRDRLIRELRVHAGASVLEIGCGTGRNLDQIAKHWPGATLMGLDISQEMLKSAQARLGADAMLRQGDATDFDARALFGQPQFERIVLSFCLSMIPDWQATLAHAMELIAPGGSLHIVDFGDMQHLPGFARKALRGWLTRFHVTPRIHLSSLCAELAQRKGMVCHRRIGPCSYYELVVLSTEKPQSRLQ